MCRVKEKGVKEEPWVPGLMVMPFMEIKDPEGGVDWGALLRC